MMWSKQLTRRVMLSLVPVLLAMTFAGAAPDETPCGVVAKTGKGVQLIPNTGSVQTQFTKDGPVSCATMVITHEEPFWVRLSDQTVIKVAPQSFVEIPKSGSKIYHLYRGQVFVTAPPGVSTQTWSTPNAESLFKGGIAFIQYQPDTRVSTVSCFNREFEFRNKFNESAVTVVHAGEMSHLAIQEASVNPSQPAVMNRASALEVLAKLKLSESDQSELVAVVKRVYDDRAKSLTSEIEDWNSEPTAPGPSRSIASVNGVAKPEKAVDEKEAEFVTRMMNKHLFGSVGDAKAVEQRKPASVIAVPIVVDAEQKKRTDALRKETKRLEKEIGRIHEDE